MPPKTIGIIGGAGPMAGSALLNLLFRLSIENYGCFKDADFPKVILISYPFSEMLSSDKDETAVKKELKQCLCELRQAGAHVVAIACNTLHAFLESEDDDLIHMPQEIAAAISDTIPLVLCTSTSRQKGLHQRYFRCVYPEKQEQDQVDTIIEKILKGFDQTQNLSTLLQAQKASTVVLGCTELSLFAEQLQGCNKTVVDPLKIIAQKILKNSFRR